MSRGPARPRAPARYDSCFLVDRERWTHPIAEAGKTVLGKTTKDTKKGRGVERPDVDSVATSVISRDMQIIGDCRTEGQIRIDGVVSGDVTARGLELSSTGSVEGDVVGSGKAGGDHVVVIDGAVHGSVSAGRVEVRHNGSVANGVVADDAVVHGRVSGGILARKRLALEGTAAVEGDVRASRLGLKEGARVNGTISMDVGPVAVEGTTGEPASSKDAGGEAPAPRVGSEAEDWAVRNGETRAPELSGTGQGRRASGS